MLQTNNSAENLDKTIKPAVTKPLHRRLEAGGRSRYLFREESRRPLADPR